MENFQSFSQNKQLLKDIEENIPKLKEEFEKLKDLRKLEVSDPNFNAAITSFYILFQFIPLQAPQFSENMRVFRARPNDNKNILYENVSDISYRTFNPQKIRVGRFNQPGQAMFYSTLQVEDNDYDASFVACMETCKGLSDIKNPIKIKDMTIGRWRVKSPFFVIVWCFDEEHLKTNKIVKAQADEYINFLKGSLSSNASTFIIEFLTYFSEMAGTKALSKNDYYILTAMIYALRYYYKKLKNEDIYGLIYPSAMIEKKGLSLVLTPEAVDQFLTPEKVLMYRFIRSDQNMIGDYCSNMVDVIDDKFNITGFRPVADNAWYTNECENDTGEPLKQSK